VTIAQLLPALRARLGVFGVLFATTVFVATVTSLLLPKSYRATVSLLVDAKDEQSISGVLRPLVLPQERLSYLQTQRDIITSERVARKVVRDLKLAQNPFMQSAVRDAAKDGVSAEDMLVERLLKKLSVETTQSNVVQASYSSSDPRFAALIANAFARAYIDTMLELRVEPTREAAAWFDEQLKTLRANLENAQAQLTEYHQRQGIVSADEHLDVENTRLGALSDELTKAQQQALEWSGREREARTYLQQGGAPEKLPDVLDNPFVQRLKADLLHGEARLREISAQYGSNYPLYQRQASENQSLRERLDAEMRKVAVAVEVGARESRQREADLTRALAAQRARLLGLKESRNEFTVLRRNVESAERAYDTAMQRSVVSQVDSRASQTNVTVLNPATVPATPYRPRVILNIVLSTAVGILLGLGAVILLEMLDRRVRSEDDLENGSDIPLLGVLHAWKPAAISFQNPSRVDARSLPNPG
jgi:chain length determinant protein EpsF